tara:strand:- start:805 stop:1347 length:543 start_codon:yes stop_codon:yes gene_type:complete
MNKSESEPNLLTDKVHTFRKSKSTGDFSENKFIFEEFFEGDGPLGIKFYENKEGKSEISRIDKGTVASEMYGLTINMILIKIGNKDISHKTHDKNMDKISKIWKKQSCIHLTFIKRINQTVYRFLNDLDLIKYYDDFIELGAKELDDFDFVEQNDLIKFGMDKQEILRFNKMIERLETDI